MHTPRPSLTRLEAAALCGVAAVLFCLFYTPLAAAVSAARSRGFAPNDACVGNLRALSFALVQYTQDNDELLPPAHTAAEFQAALLPFAKVPSLFICPDTGLPYTPNATLSYQSIGAFADPETVEVAQDTKPHTDGLTTVLFLDNHVERGGVEQGDPSLLCIAHARTVDSGILRYITDHDQVYPPMQSESEFETAVYPYTRSHRAFINPIDGKPFVLNAALSGVPASSVTDPAHTVLFQSAGLLPNSYPVIAYADGHVTNGPVRHDTYADSQRDQENLQRIMEGVLLYIQDNEQYLPTTTDYSLFKAELLPYVGSDESLFVSPGSGLPYVLNPAISGLYLGNIADQSGTEFMRDPRRNTDGTLNIAFVDGHVKQDLVYVPQTISLGPDDSTLLLWRDVYGLTPLWTLAPDGTTLDSNTDKTEPMAVGYANVGLDNKVHVAHGTGFGFALETLSANGSIETAHNYGIYDGWKAYAASGPNGTLHRLYQRYDGRLALWNISPDGRYLGNVALKAPAKMTVVGLAAGSDSLTRILWRDPSGQATVWLLSAAGKRLASVTLPAPAGLTPAAITVGPDNRVFLLWDGEQDRAQIWVEGGKRSGQVLPIPLPGGGQATSLVVGAGGDLRVLWRGEDLTGRLQTLQADGKVLSVRAFAAYH